MIFSSSRLERRSTINKVREQQALKLYAERESIRIDNLWKPLLHQYFCAMKEDKKTENTLRVIHTVEVSPLYIKVRNIALVLLLVILILSLGLSLYMIYVNISL